MKKRNKKGKKMASARKAKIPPDKNPYLGWSKEDIDAEMKRIEEIIQTAQEVIDKTQEERKVKFKEIKALEEKFKEERNNMLQE